MNQGFLNAFFIEKCSNMWLSWSGERIWVTTLEYGQKISIIDLNALENETIIWKNDCQYTDFVKMCGKLFSEICRKVLAVYTVN